MWQLHVELGSGELPVGIGGVSFVSPEPIACVNLDVLGYFFPVVSKELDIVVGGDAKDGGGGECGGGARSGGWARPSRLDEDDCLFGQPSVSRHCWHHLRYVDNPIFSGNHGDSLGKHIGHTILASTTYASISPASGAVVLGASIVFVVAVVAPQILLCICGSSRDVSLHKGMLGDGSCRNRELVFGEGRRVDNFYFKRDIGLD